ncbi:MAG: glycosyltransferase family 4 protein [Desulfovermiculus sp.]|nr:glycosyltransferase family 4 protein [Desulfovermiculus sp.]
MTYRVLCLTDQSDLPETELFIGLYNAGVDIEVACNPKGRYFERLQKSEVCIHKLIAESRFSIQSIQNIRRILARKDYDILYCFNNKAASNLLMATWGQKYKIITYRGTVGNVGFLSPASWTTHLHPRVDRIVCVSKAVREHLVGMRFLGMGIGPDKAVAIYKGHDFAWYQSPPADLAREFGIPADAFVVGFAGRNRPHKGISHLIDATRHLPGEANIHFLLLGRLKEDRSLKRKIAQSPHACRIHLPGFREDAPAVFAACDTFIMPSTKREGLSRAVIEAMARGTPPIVTDVGGLPELVIHGQSGIVVKPEDAYGIAEAILRLAQNPEEKRRMGVNARQRIQEHFHIQQTVSQTRSLFEHLMAAE